jgi:DNA-binding MarR family transcriptional regulator
VGFLFSSNGLLGIAPSFPKQEMRTKPGMVDLVQHLEPGAGDRRDADQLVKVTPAAVLPAPGRFHSLCIDALTDALLTASRLLVAISARSIAFVDETITIPQFRTLVILSNEGPVNLSTLAGLLDVQPSTIGRMVERLVSAGLIDRKPNPSSRRELTAGLTPRGRRVVQKVTARRRAEITRVVRKMPARERRGLVGALTAFAAAGGEPAVAHYANEQ